MGIEEFLHSITEARTIDLAPPYFVGMPHHPRHPPFPYGWSTAHGDSSVGGTSTAADSTALGGHVGTHVDALGHSSFNGKLLGGVDAIGCQSYLTGLSEHHVDMIDPIFRQVVQLDVAASEGLDVLSPTSSWMQTARSELPSGPEPSRREQAMWSSSAPAGRSTGTRRNGSSMTCSARGINHGAACWLSARDVIAGGSDTIAFEFMPAPSMPVHVHLLQESRVHFLEVLNLEALAASRVSEFVFAAAPLRIRGGTGSPMRPGVLAPH